MLIPCILLALTSRIYAQLSLPSPAWLPPNASTGAIATSGSNTSVPNEQWSTLLGDLLYAYEAQRSGQLPDTNRVTWRNSSALKDGSDVGLDLTGGYYDAGDCSSHSISGFKTCRTYIYAQIGDYIKVGFPLSFTLSSICWGATDFGKGYDLTNQTAYLDSMLRWGLDWLIKIHSSNDTLYIAIGNSTFLSYIPRLYRVNGLHSRHR